MPEQPRAPHPRPRPPAAVLEGADGDHPVPVRRRRRARLRAGARDRGGAGAACRCDEIALDDLHPIVEGVLRARDGEASVARYRAWQQVLRRERPLILLIGGATGTGKSTLATELAYRLGISRITSTDVVRQVMRAFFAPALMPALHYQLVRGRRRAADPDARPRPGRPRALRLHPAGRAGGGGRRRGGRAGGAWRASRRWSRACTWCPGWSSRADHGRRHGGPGDAGDRGRGGAPVPLRRPATRRPAAARALERYLRRFGEIRRIQDYLVARARADGSAGGRRRGRRCRPARGARPDPGARHRRARRRYPERHGDRATSSAAGSRLGGADATSAAPAPIWPRSASAARWPPGATSAAATAAAADEAASEAHGEGDRRAAGQRHGRDRPQRAGPRARAGRRPWAAAAGRSSWPATRSRARRGRPRRRRRALDPGRLRARRDDRGCRACT